VTAITTAKTGEQENVKADKQWQQHLSSGGGKIAVSSGRGCYSNIPVGERF